MCKGCRETEEGKAVLAELVTLEQQLIAIGVNPGIAGFLYSNHATTDQHHKSGQTLFTGNKAELLAAYTEAKQRLRQIHSNFVLEGMQGGNPVVIFACPRQK